MVQPVATQLDHLQPQTGRMALLQVRLTVIIHIFHIYDLEIENEKSIYFNLKQI